MSKHTINLLQNQFPTVTDRETFRIFKTTLSNFRITNFEIQKQKFENLRKEENFGDVLVGSNFPIALENLQEIFRIKFQI